MKYVDAGSYSWEQQELICRYGDGRQHVVCTKKEAEDYEEKKWHDRVAREQEAKKSSTQLRAKMHTAALKEPPAWDEVDRLAGLVAAAEVREEYSDWCVVKPEERKPEPSLRLSAGVIMLLSTICIVVGWEISKIIIIIFS